MDGLPGLGNTIYWGVHASLGSSVPEVAFIAAQQIVGGEMS